MSNRRSALCAVCLSALISAACEKAPASPPSSPPADAAATPEAEPDSLLHQVQGAWVGEYKLNWMDPSTSAFSEEVSRGTATVSGDRIEYTWEFRGEPQSGTIELERVDAGVQTRFVDTWHTPDGKALVSTGSIEGGRVDVRASYPAGEGPDWGWRTEVDVADQGAFGFRMYNITPDGQEVIAVDVTCRRAE